MRHERSSQGSTNISRYGCIAIALCLWCIAVPTPTLAAPAATPSTKIYQPAPSNLKLNIAIPGLEFATDVETKDGEILIPWLAQYISAIYKYIVGISIVAASIMIVYGGFLYVAGSTISSIQSGKETIQNALIGLILTIGLVLTINVIGLGTDALKPLRIIGIKQQAYEFAIQQGGEGVTGLPSQATAGGSPGGPAPSGKAQSSELYTIFGSSDEEVGKQIVYVTFNGRTYGVHKLSAEAFKTVFSAIEAAPANSPIGIWREQDKKNKVSSGAYMPRMGKQLLKNPNWKPNWDMHTLGLAVDLDAGHNPFIAGDNWNRLPEEVQKNPFSPVRTNMPKELVELFEANKFYWGGYGWGEKKTDAMHFEWHGLGWK